MSQTSSRLSSASNRDRGPVVVVPSSRKAMLQCHGVVKAVSVGSRLTDSLFSPVDGWMESLSRSRNFSRTARANA